MTAMWRLRAAVLTLVGVLAVHQGRYALAPPEHGHEFGAAHAYFTWLVPLAGALLFLTITQVGLLIRRATGEAPALPRGRALWAAATVSTLGVLGVQETLETWVTHGYVPGLAELVAGGGWIAGPLALLAGAAIALALRGAARAVGWALGRRAPSRSRAAAPALRFPVVPLLSARGCELARLGAGRAPPAGI